MIARTDWVPPNYGESNEKHFNVFAEKLDDLLSEYSELLPLGDILSTLAVSQHSLIAQSIEASKAEDAAK